MEELLLRRRTSNGNMSSKVNSTEMCCKSNANSTCSIDRLAAVSQYFHVLGYILSTLRHFIVPPYNHQTTRLHRQHRPALNNSNLLHCCSSRHYLVLAIRQGREARSFPMALCILPNVRHFRRLHHGFGRLCSRWRTWCCLCWRFHCNLRHLPRVPKQHHLDQQQPGRKLQACSWYGLSNWNWQFWRRYGEQFLP